MTAALCPGSFDPPTNGHLDIIRRSAGLFDRLVVAVVENPSKRAMFSAEERVALIQASVPELENIEVLSFSGLLVDFARDVEVDVVIKGLRGGADFEYEMQMGQMNQAMTGLETTFLATSPAWGFVSSSLVREICKLGGDVAGFVSKPVFDALQEKV